MTAKVAAVGRKLQLGKKVELTVPALAKLSVKLTLQRKGRTATACSRPWLPNLPLDNPFEALNQGMCPQRRHAG